MSLPLVRLSPTNRGWGPKLVPGISDTVAPSIPSTDRIESPRLRDLDPQADSCVLTASANSRLRVTVDGKFFRLGEAKFHPRGVTYGPFEPDATGSGFASPEQTASDLLMIRELGANLVRVYFVPPRWFLDLALANELRVFVDVAWNQHVCFLDDASCRAAATEAVVAAAQACAHHPAVFALSVVNEIPADIVRWSGSTRVGEFIDELVCLAKTQDPDLLCTFGNFPPTEFLESSSIDFLCFNVYLHAQRPFENYLARLQMLADVKPLLIGEFGIDTLREGEQRQGEILSWKIKTAFRCGCAGVVVYSFTDDWWKDGRAIEDWAFGLTTRSREKKPAFDVVKKQFALAPYFPPSYFPRVSVVVASYNGAPTLKTCLQSLERLNYPEYEVILVDDGSTDATESIAALFPSVRYFRHAQNQGLSSARNTGITAATGEIVAFTDSDCRADEDWLHYLIGDLLSSRFTGIGGHNFLPPDDSVVAAAVMVSPGGPAHVMLNDRLAEHIPGCNMAFYRWALVEIGGFDPLYRKAGDDVDICWRLQQRSYLLGFSPAGFVWHYRRNTVKAYLRQQIGYGEAEAILERRHPENFNRFGGSMWHGRIYSPAKISIETRRPIIYHGLFGSGFFQSIYASSASLTLVASTSLEFHTLVTLPLLVLGAVVPFVATLGIASLVFSLSLCVVAASQAELPRNKHRWWSRPLVALLFFLQPVVRGWARHQRNLFGQQASLEARESLDSLSLEGPIQELRTRLYWVEKGLDRMAFLARVIERLDQRGWRNKPDAGWSRYDVEIQGSRWARLQLTTAAEFHPGGRQLLRCRLEARWSLFGRALFWSVAGLELVLIGFLTRGWPTPQWWSWLILLTLPALIWFLNESRRDLLRLIAAFMDDRAKEFGMVNVRPRNASSTTTG
jgi:glycosyltransferase involved in cell wall biosynthesis